MVWYSYLLKNFPQFIVIHTIKDRNGIDLTEAEDIKNKWQEYTEELYQKNFHDHIIMMVSSLTLTYSKISRNVKSSWS